MSAVVDLLCGISGSAGLVGLLFGGGATAAAMTAIFGRSAIRREAAREVLKILLRQPTSVGSESDASDAGGADSKRGSDE